MNKEKIVKAISIIGASALLVGAGIAGTSIVKNDTIQEQAAQLSHLQLESLKLNSDIVDLKNVAPVIEYKDRNVTVELEVEKEVLVEVDNENLDLVLEHVYDNNGNVEYLLDDLDDDEVDQVVDRIVFVNDIKALAVAEADKEIADLLDKEEYVFNNETIKFDEDDVERVRVQDDDDEVIVSDADFEDGDADVAVEVRFEQDDLKYVALVKVEIKDSEVDDIDLISVEER